MTEAKLCEFTKDGQLCEGCSRLHNHTCAREHTCAFGIHKICLGAFLIPKHLKSVIGTKALEEMHSSGPLRMIFSTVPETDRETRMRNLLNVKQLGCRMFCTFLLEKHFAKCNAHDIVYYEYILRKIKEKFTTTQDSDLGELLTKIKTEKSHRVSYEEDGGNSLRSIQFVGVSDQEKMNFIAAADEFVTDFQVVWSYTTDTHGDIHYENILVKRLVVENEESTFKFKIIDLDFLSLSRFSKAYTMIARDDMPKNDFITLLTVLCNVAYIRDYSAKHLVSLFGNTHAPEVSLFLGLMFDTSKGKKETKETFCGSDVLISKRDRERIFCVCVRLFEESSTTVSCTNEMEKYIRHAEKYYNLLMRRQTRVNLMYYVDLQQLTRTMYSKIMGITVRPNTLLCEQKQALKLRLERIINNTFVSSLPASPSGKQLPIIAQICEDCYSTVHDGK